MVLALRINDVGLDPLKCRRIVLSIPLFSFYFTYDQRTHSLNNYRVLKKAIIFTIKFFLIKVVVLTLKVN